MKTPPYTREELAAIKPKVIERLRRLRWQTAGEAALLEKLVWQDRELRTGREMEDEIAELLRTGLEPEAMARILTGLVIRDRNVHLQGARVAAGAQEAEHGGAGVIPPLHADGNIGFEGEVANFGIPVGAGEVAPEAMPDLKEAGVVVVTDGDPEAFVAGEGAVVESAKVTGDREGAHGAEGEASTGRAQA